MRGNRILAEFRRTLLGVAAFTAATCVYERMSVVARSTFHFHRHRGLLKGEQFKGLYRVSILQFILLHDTIAPHGTRSQREGTILAACCTPNVLLCVTFKNVAEASYLDV